MCPIAIIMFLRLECIENWIKLHDIILNKLNDDLNPLNDLTKMHISHNASERFK